MTRLRPAAAIAMLLVAGLTAACSSSSAPAHRSHTVSDRPLPPAPTSNGPTQPSAPPAVTASAPASTYSSRSATGSAATSGTSAQAARRSTCSAVTVRVIRGSADVGREIAALQFTNAGSRPCTLYGYPTVALLRNGQVFGAPAQPATSASSMRRLGPGATAESMLTDYTNCQARLSDQIRVVVPGSGQSAVRPAQLRACTLRVAALGAPQ